MPVAPGETKERSTSDLPPAIVSVDPLQPVPQGGMGNLMSDHTGNLFGIVRGADQPRKDNDRSTGQTKCIDAG